VVTIKSSHLLTKSPILWVGLMVFLLLLDGCKPANTPEGIALAFWQALAASDIDKASGYITQQSIPLNKNPELPELKNATLKTGQIVINGQNATVEILVTTEQHPVITLKTFLTKEHNLWKVDYRRTLNHLRQMPFNDFFKGLESFGGVLNEQLEQGLEQLGETLKKQMDEFGRELQKNLPPKKPPTDGSI
jgi:hypothetical protein